MDEYWGYEKWQAFILTQREVDNKCSNVDRRGSTEFRETELQRSRMTTELIQLTNQPKTEAVVTETRAVPTAVSGTSVTRADAPRPTPQNTERAGRWSRWILFGRLLVVIRFVIIVAPFINIAVHVV